MGQALLSKEKEDRPTFREGCDENQEELRRFKAG